AAATAPRGGRRPLTRPPRPCNGVGFPATTTASRCRIIFSGGGAAPAGVDAQPQGDDMDNNDLNRRDFQKLAMAALGGLVAGAGLAHADEAKDKDDKKD